MGDTPEKEADEADVHQQRLADNVKAAHGEHIKEYAAARVFVGPNGTMLRIAFGQSEIRNVDGTWVAPRYQVAVSMPPNVAKVLRDWLLKMYPVKAPETPSANIAAELAQELDPAAKPNGPRTRKPSS
jgi:hypothetical protein